MNALPSHFYFFALAFALGSLFLGLFSPQRFVTPNLYTARNFVSPPPARKVNRLNNLVSHLSQRVTRLHSTMSTDTAPTATDGSEFFRLPRQVTPSHYDLTVLSDLESLTFSGIVTVHLDVHEETDKVIVNLSPKLGVGKAVVASDALKTESRNVTALDLDGKHERATASLAAKLPKGSKATITIPFEGAIDKSMTGYYQSSWEHEGKKGSYALTQFEPTFARKAFPSFDEPGLKATYSFTMIHRKDTVALGNMPALSTKDISYAEAQKVLRLKELEVQPPVSSHGKTEGKTETKTETGSASSDSWSITTFDKTPLLSSYLIAWGNGPFVHIESSYTSSDGRKIPLRVYTTPEYIHQAQYTLEVTAKVLPVYEKVFNEPYMMPKCDTLIGTCFEKYKGSFR